METAYQNYIDKANKKISIGKYESSRLRGTYLNYKNNIEKKNNLNKIIEKKEGSSKKENKMLLIKNKDKNISNKRKHKGENKIKYNDLIKYKLSMCDSINKRKNIRNNGDNY